MSSIFGGSAGAYKGELRTFVGKLPEGWQQESGLAIGSLPTRMRVFIGNYQTPASGVNPASALAGLVASKFDGSGLYLLRNNTTDSRFIDIATEAGQDLPPLPASVAADASALVDTAHGLYVFGSTRPAVLRNGAWTLLPTYSYRRNARAVLLPGRNEIVLIGGLNSSAAAVNATSMHADAIVINCESGEVVRTLALPFGAAHAHASRLTDDAVLLMPYSVGTESGVGAYYRSCYVLDTVNGGAPLTDPLPTGVSALATNSAGITCGVADNQAIYVPSYRSAGAASTVALYDHSLPAGSRWSVNELSDSPGVQSYAFGMNANATGQAALARGHADNVLLAGGLTVCCLSAAGAPATSAALAYMSVAHLRNFPSAHIVARKL